MIKRLLALKESCNEYLPSCDQLKVTDWTEIEELLKVLAPVNSLTLKLQQSNLILGDFYKFWLEVIFKLKEINSVKSKEMINYIQSRQDKLLENNTLYAALFLDPRFMRVLSKDKIQTAKMHLKHIVRQIINVNKQDNHSQEMDNTREDLFSNVDHDSNASLLRNNLRNMEQNNFSDEEDEIDENTKQAFFEIDNYREKRLDVECDLMQYWSSKEYSLPWLYKLAIIIHSVPATQVSVEQPRPSPIHAWDDVTLVNDRSSCKNKIFSFFYRRQLKMFKARAFIRCLISKNFMNILSAQHKQTKIKLCMYYFGRGWCRAIFFRS